MLSLLSATAHPMDSVEVSLLTCEPGTESWAQYGHTAVRWHDRQEGGMDVAINYGVFSPDAPHFVLRFILGLTDYQLGVIPFELFCDQYRYEERTVWEQVLNLDNADKEAIFKALQDNMRPENVVYRYNFFYDNCTTRARDLLVNHLHGKVSYPPARKSGDTFRQMIHEYNAPYPWAQLGEDLLLGVNADRATTKAQQQFLPDHLRADFDHTLYRGKPFVKLTREVVSPAKVTHEEGFLPTPNVCAGSFLLLAVVMFLLQWKQKKVYWGWDLFLMLLSGIVGVILTMMIFSQHPCVSFNLLLFVFNPLPLVFAYRATQRTRHQRPDRWWTVWAVLILLGLFGRVFQYYTPAVLVVALVLLIHCVMHPLLLRRRAAMTHPQNTNG